jgi:hypothetical protein
MSSYQSLESTIFRIYHQRTLSDAFFKKLEHLHLNKEVDLSVNIIIIPKKIVPVGSMKGLGEIKENGDLHLTPEVSFIVRDFFGVKLRKEELEEGDEEYREERELLGIIPRDEFEQKFPNIKLEPLKHSYEYVPMPSISYNDFCLISNNVPSFKFLLNPQIGIRPYSSNGTIKLQKVEIDLKRQVVSGDRFGKKLATQFSIACKCGKSILIYPNDMHSTITHTCGFEVIDGKDKVIKNRLDKTGLCPVVEREMWLYEVKIPNIKNSNKMDEIYLYAFEPDIEPGRYVVDIWNAYVWENSKKSYMFYPIILGFEKKNIEIEGDLIVPYHPKAKEYCQGNGLPYARFLDVLFSAKDLAIKYGGRELDDRGMLLQLFITNSIINKHLHSFDKLGVLSMGNKSLSKTYPSYLLGILLDSDFQHVGSSQDVSLAGLRGGINNHKLINGQTASVFEKGIFSVAGITLFDEGELFFSNPDMNMVLKTFLDEYIDIKKIGGGKIEQSYTPLIMSNFPLVFSGEYIDMVKDTYEKLNKISSETHDHGLSKEEIASYIRDINLYLPVSRYADDYQNQTLAKTIAYVRHFFNTKGIDWRTGGSLPSSYRLLLDCVCWNTEEFSFKDEDRIIGQTESVLPQQNVFPTIEIIETLKRIYDNKMINLKYEKLNDVSVIEKLDELETEITEWFRNDEKGKILFGHLAQGTIQIDPKINGLTYTFIKGMQCFEDISNSGRLSGKLSNNVKEWVFLILSKCKRGVTKDEYDFKEHYMDLIPKNEKFSMLEAEIEKIKSMEEEETLDAKIEKHLKKHTKDEIVLDEI